MTWPARGCEHCAGTIVLSSEFASVTVTADLASNGPRLRIEDRRSGRFIYLDPLELASLTLASHDRLGDFLDPSQNGWPRRAGNDESSQTEGA